MGRIILAFIIGGIALIVFGAREMMLGRVAKPTPQEMTCSQLCTSGPGDNAHIAMTEFIPCTFSCVVKESKRRSSWAGAWVPLVPRDGDYAKTLMAMVDENGEIDGELPVPQDVKVVAWVPKARDEADLLRLEGTTRLQGMVINEISGLGTKERQLLQQSYPQSNFNTCYVFEVGRTPTGIAGSVGMIAGGAAVAGLPIGLMVLRRRNG